MSPRRNRPRRRGPKPPEDEPRPLSTGIVAGAPDGWQAREITAERALKEYRCPGCNHEIRPGTPHVVAWGSGREDQRRHWHKACWASFTRTTR